MSKYKSLQDAFRQAFIKSGYLYGRPVLICFKVKQIITGYNYGKKCI
ncbi:hypothetical protein DCCM_3579 [Desulfocucumis palustris]|uniref:Uncharacterized protein n=1 Tax=Desulfocucumis palustris TaxID=1898651 RepID=A0A2L2XKL4_9FIRM|nr:hypothetical protein DCCM_3579 [Desulfocucumis palustris]